MYTTLGHRYDNLHEYTEGDAYYDEGTGMLYECYTAHPMNPVAYPGGIVAVSHEDVGLVTYYGFNARSERLTFIPRDAECINA